MDVQTKVHGLLAKNVRSSIYLGSFNFRRFGPSTFVFRTVHFDPVTVKGVGLAKHENIFSHSPINE